MQSSSRRIAVAATLVFAVVALVTAVGAGAGDGRGRGGDDRADASRHDRGQGGARQERRKDDDERGERRNVLVAALAPSLPTDPRIHGVAAGGAPWVLDEGAVRVRADGRIRVRVEGLVIPVAHGTFPAGTARPVTTVAAALYCAPDTSAAAATTTSVPISEDGDARIDDTVRLPATCLAPAVLVLPNGSTTAYIAATGRR